MPSPTITGLNEHYAIPGVAEIVPGNGGLPVLEITSAAAGAQIYLHGAQLTSWKPAGNSEVIFVSAHSHWEEGKAIRGGIPICFPWFRGKADDPKAPAHGFARTRSWQLVSVLQNSDAVVATLATESDEASRKWWPFEFRLALRIAVGAELTLEFAVTNPGTVPFRFEEALHTYHRVGDVEAIHITGLDGATFLDNQDSNREKTQHGDLILTKATDNAYLNTAAAVEIVDPALHRRIRLYKSGSSTTVAWNPWKDSAHALADLGDDEWRQMVCVEASNILSDAVTLPPGETHTMTAVIRITPESV